MSKKYWSATVSLDKSDRGIFVYHCEHSQVSGLEEQDDSIRVYLPEGETPSSWTDRLSKWAKCAPESIDWQAVEAKNWNRDWELNFDPVQIGSFCGIRAPFHEAFDAQVDFEITIQPEMAFGTGHHETTSMMIEAMEDLSFRGRDVLDWGSGTGILAILAKKLGANIVHALEKDETAIQNTAENIDRNEVEIEILEGSLEALPEELYFDIIIANINRTALLDGRDALAKHAKKGTDVLLSGLQRRDIPQIQRTYARWDQAVELFFRGNWVCLQFEWSEDVE